MKYTNPSQHYQIHGWLQDLCPMPDLGPMPSDSITPPLTAITRWESCSEILNIRPFPSIQGNSIFTQLGSFQGCDQNNHVQIALQHEHTWNLPRNNAVAASEMSLAPCGNYVSHGLGGWAQRFCSARERQENYGNPAGHPA